MEEVRGKMIDFKEVYKEMLRLTDDEKINSIINRNLSSEELKREVKAAPELFYDFITTYSVYRLVKRIDCIDVVLSINWGIFISIVFFNDSSFLYKLFFSITLIVVAYMAKLLRRLKWGISKEVLFYWIKNTEYKTIEQWKYDTGALLKETVIWAIMFALIAGVVWQSKLSLMVRILEIAPLLCGFVSYIVSFDSFWRSRQRDFKNIKELYEGVMAKDEEAVDEFVSFLKQG